MDQKERAWHHGAFMGPPWAPLGPHWAPLGPLGGALGPHGPHGTHGGPMGPPRAPHGPPWGPNGAQWGSMAPHGAPCGPRGGPRGDIFMVGRGIRPPPTVAPKGVKRRHMAYLDVSRGTRCTHQRPIRRAHSPGPHLGPPGPPRGPNSKQSFKKSHSK